MCEDFGLALHRPGLTPGRLGRFTKRTVVNRCLQLRPDTEDFLVLAADAGIPITLPVRVSARIERFHNGEEVAGCSAVCRERGRFATSTRPVRRLLQHSATAAGAGSADPNAGLHSPPKAVPTGPVIPAHYRLRQDKIDSAGSVTIRHNTRLYHIGLRARLAGTPVSLLIDKLHVRVIYRDTGQLVRELTSIPQ